MISLLSCAQYLISTLNRRLTERNRYIRMEVFN